MKELIEEAAKNYVAEEMNVDRAKAERSIYDFKQGAIFVLKHMIDRYFFP